MGCCNPMLEENGLTESNVTEHTSKFDTQKKRSTFIAKIYGALSLCLLVTSIQVVAVLTK